MYMSSNSHKYHIMWCYSSSPALVLASAAGLCPWCCQARRQHGAVCGKSSRSLCTTRVVHPHLERFRRGEKAQGKGSSISWGWELMRGKNRKCYVARMERRKLYSGGWYESMKRMMTTMTRMTTRATAGGRTMWKKAASGKREICILVRMKIIYIQMEIVMNIKKEENFK